MPIRGSMNVSLTPELEKFVQSRVAIPKYLLSLAGEYRVCSELNKRGVFATVTYGNRKDVCVYAISDAKHRALKVEVKTSQTRYGKFLTRVTQEFLVRHRDRNPPFGEPDNNALWKAILDDPDPQAPDFWVLFQVLPHEDGSFEERFFVLTQRELCEAQVERNRLFNAQYTQRNRRPFDFSKGVDGVRIADIEEYCDKNQWSKILGALDSANPFRTRSR
ncbi:MAG TPA: hypothetical protein VMT20_00715 [Terriglobia bacterium]|nr:hypothetical protein [Terriglobia bacterium]